nr:hypothetical protein [Tanacetum cinerariifolium]
MWVPPPKDNVMWVPLPKDNVCSLVRVATTASSLEAEQDSGNITKTQSKATPNESSSQGTNSGGGPRCQETIRDTTTQTRFESVSKHSNDSLLARGNILQSDEDCLKLNELMALCTNLQNRVLDLEKTKTNQRNEINSLKRRVKKLEKRNRMRIDAIDADDEITLVNEADNEMFDVNDLGGAEVFVARKNDNVVEEVVNVAQASTAVTTTTIITEEITLAQALEELKTSKPKVKGTVFQEPKMFNRSFRRVNTFEDFRPELVEGKEKRAGEELEQEITKKQKVEDDKEKTLLPQIRAEIREEFRTGSRPSSSGGNPPPVTIHTWLERFNKQNPR